MRVQVFIDGGNFHHLALKPLGLQESGFDFDAFVSFLADGREISENGKRFYIGTVREKGIDVKIATDLVAAALDDKYDIAILVSSDSDLVPMIDWIRYRLKKKIEYIGFSIPDKSGTGSGVRPTQSLISRTDIQRVLVESDIRKFLRPEQPELLK